MRLRSPGACCHGRIIKDAARGVIAHLSADATTHPSYGAPAGLRIVIRGKATATVTACRSRAHTEPRCRARQGVVPYQICDTTSRQVYGGAGAEHPLANAAVGATAREILTYRGKAAFIRFSSSIGGWTAKGSVSYLPAQTDPYAWVFGLHTNWSTVGRPWAG